MCAMSTNFDSNKYCEIKEYNGVREIILNDFKTRNSLSLNMMDEILTGLTENCHDQNLRCIIMSAKGPVWSAGLDINELAVDCSNEWYTILLEKISSITYNIRNAPVPVIAKVNGLVCAGGVQVLNSCHIVVCSLKSKFVISSATIGLFASPPAVKMSRLISHNKCLDMLMTGHAITADEACKLCLFSRVVAEVELNNEIKKIVNAIQNKNRAVLTLSKDFFYHQLELSMEESYRLADKVMKN